MFFFQKKFNKKLHCHGWLDRVDRFLWQLLNDVNILLRDTSGNEKHVPNEGPTLFYSHACVIATGYMQNSTIFPAKRTS